MITDHVLEGRPSRPPGYAAENAALVALARELAKPESDVLRVLSMAALDLCRAGSAGISLLEYDAGRTVFRWHSIVGRLAHLEGSSIARDASPCGVVIGRRQSTLMSRPELHFAALTGIDPPIHEALLIPFTMLDEPVGTVWVVSHDELRRFDAEDRRIMSSLAAFASAAFTLRASMQSALDHAAKLGQAKQQLRRLAKGQA
ncbi:MAG: GAF domain-containing protein [Tepidisphaeraceae bacterium]